MERPVLPVLACLPGRTKEGPRLQQEQVRIYYIVLLATAVTDLCWEKVQTRKDTSPGHR